MKNKKKIEQAVDKMLNKEYNPGSDEAIRKGCQCPVLDNGHGFGYMGQEGLFVYNSNCPVHGYRDE